jgi:outer membrane protein OmpA-like peptidoglycan-associated protein
MKLRAPLFALAFVSAAAQAAEPAPALAFPWPMAPVAAQAAPAMPKNPEEWMTRMTDFTRNASAYKDPRVFVPWSHAVTEPGFYLTAVKGAMEPGGWLNMMNSMANPAAVQNYMAFADPNLYMRWMQAGMDPAFYTAMLTQFTDPGKMMRWAMMPLDPKVWDIATAAVNPNTYIRWPMAGMDPRTWNLMGNMMNPALYTSMAGMAMNPNAMGPGINPWLSWKPVNVSGASSPWGADPVASFNMFDPALLSNLGTFLPTLSLPGLPNLGATAPAAATPANPTPAAEPSKPAVDDNKIVLAADALFKSGKASIKDLSKDGKSRLDDIATRLKSLGEIEQIKIVGHADVMGKADANRRLSEKRARSVKSYLVAKGVKPGVIITSGVGDTQPVVQCDTTMPKKELVACLAPNRRVEIEVVAKPKE